MANQHAIHFDAGVAPPELVATGGVSLSTTVKRTGGYSLRISSAASNFTYYGRLTLSTALSEFCLQFAFYYTLIGTSDSRILQWKSAGGTVLGGLVLNMNSKKLEVYTGNFATLVATGEVALNPSTMYVIELYTKIDAAGSITVRVDLSPDSTFSGNTKPGADTSVGIIDWGNIVVGATCYIYIDDIIINSTTGTRNNSWPNGAKVYYLVPTGDGATKNWTPSAGTDHYALVDEIPPSATDNLQATAVDVVDILTFGNLPLEAVTVKAVISAVYAFKGSSVAPTRLALGIDISGEGVEYSADKDLGLAQGLVRNIWEERPGGGNFSVTDITNISLYLKSAA